MAFTKITETDLQNKGVIGLPDTPGLSTSEMQEKFDEIALDVLYPKHNEHIDELALPSAASNIGAVDVNGDASTIQAELNKIKQGGYTKSETDQLLANKQDTEVGKGLSQNDFTNAYKDKLNGIEDNANNYVLPKGSQTTLGGVMGDGTTFTIDSNGVGHAVGGGGGGTADYEALTNKPSINHVELIGDIDGSDLGFLSPIITITSDAGSTVKIKKGATEITAVQKTTTTWEAIPTSYGTWTVISSLAGADDATGTVEVDAVKAYATTVQHISASITVTYPSGAICKVSKGSTEYIATQNPQTFTVRALGVWDIEVNYNGIVKTATATISADGDSQSVTIEYASIVVTYDNNFKGTTISCSSGTTVYTKTAPSDASTITFTIPTTGTWEIRGEVSGTQYTQNITVSSYTSYSASLAVFHATVTITYPYDKGAVCTLSDGTTTLTATTSPMAFDVPNAGTWTANSTLDGLTGVYNFNITTDGQTESYTFNVGTIELIYDNEFRGLTITCEKGVAIITKTAPSTGNTMYFYPPTTGEWDISGTYSGVAYTTSATVSSLSTPVTAQLRTTVNATVTLHGAAGAIISWTDEAGSQTQTLDTGGSKTGVTIKANPNFPVVVFEDTTVGKKPCDLSANFKKSVVIKPSLTDIYVMPDNSLYWYGYEDSNLEDTTTANGWALTSTNVSFSAPTHNTRNIQATSSSDYAWQGIGSKTSLSSTVTKLKAIGQGISAGTNSDGEYLRMKANSAKTAPYSESFGTVYYKSSNIGLFSTDVTTSSAFSAFIAAPWSSSAYIHAFYYNTDSQYNFFSAADDVVTFKDSNNNDVVFAITDENGGAYVDYSAIPSGSYTLYSSVAKNPDSLSDAYSKQVSISSGTTSVYFMPNDNVIYWWGYMNNLEAFSSANGWSGHSYTAPTFNKNYINIANSTTNYVCGVGNTNPIDLSNINQFKGIAKGNSGTSNIYGTVFSIWSGTKKTTGTTRIGEGMNVDSTNMKTYSHTLTATEKQQTSCYIEFNYVAVRNNDVYALWYE